MSKSFDRSELILAFDRIGALARQHEAVLHLAVYGGSALMLASNFRFSSEDVDIAELSKPWPEWLATAVADLASENGWSQDWLNEQVNVHLSALATMDGDHLEFGTFPRSAGDAGMIVYVPTAEYMLALKLKAIRVLDPLKGEQEAQDIHNLMQAAGVAGVDEAIAVLSKFFPRAAVDPAKQRFLLNHIVLKKGGSADAPEYPLRSL